MSLKTKFSSPGKSKRTHLSLWGWLLIFHIGAVCVCPAQEPIYPIYVEPQGNNDFSENELNSSEPKDSILAPVEMGEIYPAEVITSDQTRSRGAQTFRDDIILNRRNPYGFSLSFNQGYLDGYTENSPGNERVNNSTGIISVAGQSFVNIGRQRSLCHFDFGVGYRRYFDNRGDDRPIYLGRMNYSYQISKKTLLKIDDIFSSLYNDSWSFLSMYSSFPNKPDFSDEVLFGLQRVTKNLSRISISHRLGRRVKLGAFGEHNFYRYPNRINPNNHAFKVGGYVNSRLTSWLTLTSSYSTFLNSVDDLYLGAQIHRLQVGELRFHLNRYWWVWAGGGVDLSIYQDNVRIGENVRAGIGFTSSNAAFSLAYRRGFKSTIGIAGLFMSDSVNGSLGYRITRWINARGEGYYYRNRDQSNSGLIEQFTGGGGLEFALSNNIFVTLNGYYQKQQTYGYSIEDTSFGRVTAFMGFNYVWPSWKRGE